MQFRQVDTLRSFSRRFTQRLGLLRDAPYDPSLSLLESRIVFELANARTPPRAKDLATTLGVDKGYLSRLLDGLRRRRVLTLRKGEDRREKLLALTPEGRQLFRRIDRVSRDRSKALLDQLGPARAASLSRELGAATLALGDRVMPEEVKLRTELEPGDLGWVIQRHGEIYADEYGWDTGFENLVAEIAVAFVKKHDPARERAWIATARGQRLGCVFLVREGAAVAKLRILLVEPSVRGLGLGTLLVKTCVEFARAAGYRRITLWTNDVLVSARRIYEAEGFTLEKEEKHESFGKKLTGQYWGKAL